MLPLVSLTLLVTACASVESPSVFGVGASIAPATTRPTEAPAATAVPTPTVVPTPAATPSPFGVAVFPDPDDCTNPAGGYRVAYPNSWYSNAAIPLPGDASGAGEPACQLFAPTDFVQLYGTEISSDVAIWIRVYELPEGTAWNYGPFPGQLRIFSDSEAIVGGQPARVQEIEVIEGSMSARPGDLYSQYIIELSSSRYLKAQTIYYHQEEYETNRMILDQMMQTLEFTSP